MNKIKCVLSDNLFDQANSIFKLINTQDLSKENIVFVPSGQEKWAENLLFETLKTKVLFNVKVQTLNSFVKQQTNLKPLVVPMQKHLIKKAIEMSNLSVFTGLVTDGLVNAVHEQILAFQEANLSVDEIKNTSVNSVFLKQKLEDLEKIYQCYQTLLGDEYDNAKIINLFLHNSYFSQNQRFFFVGFNGFTQQQLCIIKKLAENSCVTLSGFASTSETNGYVFDKPVWIDQLKSMGLELDVTQNQETALVLEQSIIKNTAFSVLDTKQSLDFVKVFECLDAKEEVFSLARTIKQLMFTNKDLGYEDFCVVCSNIETYRPILENIFTEFGFEYSINAQLCVNETEISRFITLVLEFLLENDIDKFLSIAFSSFSDLNNEDRFKLVNYYEANKPLSLKKDKSFLQNLDGTKKLWDNLKSLQGLEKISDIITEIFEQFDLLVKSTQLAQKLQHNGSFKQAVLNAFAPNAIKNLAENLAIKFEKKDFADFVNVLKSSLSQTFGVAEKIETSNLFVTTYQDFPKNVKHLFVLGANQGAMPSSSNDTKIITDEELEGLNLPIKTTLSRNRENRLAVLQCLIGFTNNLYISYCLQDNSGQKLLPSVFVQSLVKSAKEDIFVSLSKEVPSGFKQLSINQKAIYFAHSFGSRVRVETEFLKAQKSQNQNFLQILPIFSQIFSMQSQDYDRLAVDNSLSLFFPDNKTKISQIESYYSCPFKHFMAYGLKLTEKPLMAFQSQDVGNVLHKVAEEYLSSKNNFVENGVSPKQAVREIFEGFEKQNKFEKLFKDFNNVSLQVLKSESERLCKHLLAYSQKSAFKPKFLEVYFGKQAKFTLKVLGQDFSVVGIVDRVDEWQNNAVVIDYKTGDSIKGNNVELFYGEKLQIFVYAKAFSQLYNLNVQGVFYMPILNKFFEEKEIPYYLRGKYVKDENFLNMMDKTITFENPKSMIFPCEIKTSKEAVKSGTIEYKSRVNCVEVQDFNEMIDYAVAMTKSAIKEILEGNLSAMPTETACTNCPYLSICDKSSALVPRRKIFDVQNQHFGLWKIGDSNE